MARILFSVFAYILYFIKRKDEQILGSSFLFDFYNKTVLHKRFFSCDKIEDERSLLLSDTRSIEVVDLGAKTRRRTSNQIRKIAKNSLSPKDQGAFLGAIVHFLQPKNILEVGTSFGISTCYLAENASNSTIATLEGNESTARIAEERFKKLGYENIQITLGNFDQTLAQTLENLGRIDFVFFDGNHRYEPTMRYFEHCMKYISHNSTFVFHDIYWSKEMAKAWIEISNDKRVSISLDLYYFGIVFFTENEPKQHFVLKF